MQKLLIGAFLAVVLGSVVVRPGLGAEILSPQRLTLARLRAIVGEVTGGSELSPGPFHEKSATERGKIPTNRQ